MHTGSHSAAQILLLVLGPFAVSFLLWVLHDLHLRSKRSKEHRKRV